MKIGIIIARLQCPYLHEGHMALFQHVIERSDKVVLFIGGSETRLTINDPLPYEARRKMVEESFPDITILKMPDTKYDEAWDKSIDKTIDDIFHYDDVVLYGSRDSFIDRYKGKHKVEEFPEIPCISATRIRSSLHGHVKDSVEWREGIIFAAAHKYPTSYQAVDIAIIDFYKGQILLGKKKGEPNFRFVGGFVDVKDDSLEMAAKREAKEECGDIETDDYRYIGSFRVDDWRYRKSNDGIMTALFCCHYIFGRVNPQDDISELQWFDLYNLNVDVLEPEHRPLYSQLIKYLNADAR